MGRVGRVMCVWYFGGEDTAVDPREEKKETRCLRQGREVVLAAWNREPPSAASVELVLITHWQRSCQRLQDWTRHLMIWKSRTPDGDGACLCQHW